MRDNKIYSNSVFIALSAILCTALWGSATPFIKIGYELMIPDKDVPSTILFAGIRFLFAGILTIIIYSIARGRLLYPKKVNVSKIAIVSTFQTVIQYIFFYIGLANTTGVKGTVASGSNAFFAILLASLVFKQEKLTIKKIFACAIGFAGVILINVNGLDFNMNFTGDCFVIFAAISYAFSSVLIKRYSKYEDPVVISGYQFAMGGLFMIIIGLITGGKVDISTLPAFGVLTYLAFLSAIAYALWGVLLKYNPVSKIAIFSFMIPVFGVLLSTIMLDENSGVPVVNLFITLVLICSGIIMLNHQKFTNK
ncbi:MAG: DMT family transporter [Eubacteriales bacterium]|nr:DMT family transporter [Eubacteriales bacterium]